MVKRKVIQMLRAEIYIAAIKPEGEFFEFSQYIYNTEHKTEEDFRTSIKNDSLQIAQDACYGDGYDEVDFVAIKDIIFEEVDY